jgi:flagellar basal-body rod protein FlgC
MDHTAAFAISAAGMNVERARVEVAALNLANANTTQAPGEPGYRPMRAVPRPTAAAAQSFAAAMSTAQEATLPVAALLPSVSVEFTDAASRKVHDPGHPMADAQGFVTYPAVDAATEMVTLMSATRAYEANVAAMNTARTLALKSLDIGGAS